MPVETTWEQRGTYTRCFGTMAGGELKRELLGIGSDVRFEGIRYHILDFLDVEQIYVTDAQIREFGDALMTVARTNPNVCIAAIAVKDAATRVVQRFLSIAVSPFALELFPSVEAAREWIREQSAVVAAS